jgi:hypothetical protein
MKTKNLFSKIAFILFAFLIARCGSSSKSSQNLNGTYVRNCGGTDLTKEKLVIKNDSIVEFYESDGYDVGSDMKESYDPNKPLSIKWVLNSRLYGKVKLIENDVIIYRYRANESAPFYEEKFQLTSSGGLYRENKRTLEDEMRKPNELECHYKITYEKQSD